MRSICTWASTQSPGSALVTKLVVRLTVTMGCAGSRELETTTPSAVSTMVTRKPPWAMWRMLVWRSSMRMARTNWPRSPFDSSMR